MKKAFRALPTPHKWLLIAMLEAGDRVSVENLKDLYDKDCPDRSQEPFTDVMEDLTESFLKDMSRTKGAVSVDWIHPSCKDLVIEESARQPQLRNAFLRVMSLSGIKIAISTSGGAEGTRVFPFLTSKQSWELLQVRCSSVIAAGSDDETADLLRVVAEAHRKAPNAQSRSRVERTLDVACSEARHMWDRGAMPLSTEGLAAYCEAGSRLPKMPDLPNIESSWREKDGKVRERVHKCENIFDVDIDAVCDWVRFATMVINVNPTIIQGGNVTANFGNETAKLTYIAEKEIEDTASYDEGGSGDIFGDEADSLRWHAELVITLAKTLEYLAVMLPGDREKLQTLMVDLKERASRLVDRANRMEATPDDEGEDSYAGRSESFDVRRLFSDL
jgi:hypothetical protein